MKKITAIFLVLVTIFLVGCSRGGVGESVSKKEPVIPAKLEEMKLDEKYIANARSLNFKDELLLFMTDVYLNESGEVISPKEFKEGDSSFGEARYIVVYDIKNQETRLSKQLDNCPFKDIWGCEFGKNDTIILYSGSESKNAVYDMELNLLETTDREEVDSRKAAKKSPFYSEDTIAAKDEYVSLDVHEKNQYFYFMNEPETLYCCYNDRYVTNCDCLSSEKLMLTETNYEENRKIEFSICDYKTSLITNISALKASDYGFEYASTQATRLGKKYACVIMNFYNMNGDDDYIVKAFSWDYKHSNDKVLLNAVSYTYDTLVAECNAEILDFKEKYNIDIHLNESHEDIEEWVNCDGKIDYVLLLVDLEIIKNFIDSLPAGMLEEIYKDFDDGYSATGIRIDIVSEITKDASAFVIDNSDPMNAVFEFVTVSKINVAHEFMHLIDNRIEAHMLESDDYEKGFIDTWHELNEKFEIKDKNKGKGKNKGKDKDKDKDEDKEKKKLYKYDEKHFISDYAATNDKEDRAELFSNLYANQTYALECLKNKAIYNKATLLCKLIRESFPSCTNAEELPWEEAINQFSNN